MVCLLQSAASRALAAWAITTMPSMHGSGSDTERTTNTSSTEPRCSKCERKDLAASCPEPSTRKAISMRAGSRDLDVSARVAPDAEASTSHSSSSADRSLRPGAANMPGLAGPKRRLDVAASCSRMLAARIGAAHGPNPTRRWLGGIGPAAGRGSGAQSAPCSTASTRGPNSATKAAAAPAARRACIVKKSPLGGSAPSSPCIDRPISSASLRAASRIRRTSVDAGGSA
mmetsp:Transcript_15226/g.43154  ORF Transcript_15226/g.43154 Transcript_15226/m.43154 type:complete len:229 (-) Transcript_15226:189-875(-)